MSKQDQPTWFEHKRKIKKAAQEYRDMSDQELVDRYKKIIKWITGKYIVKKISDGVFKCKDGEKFNQKSFELAYEKYMVCEAELKRRGMDWEIDKVFDNNAVI